MSFLWLKNIGNFWGTMLSGINHVAGKFWYPDAVHDEASSRL